MPKSIDPLVIALEALCMREGGPKHIAKRIKANWQTIDQIIKGVQLPSGNPRGVGPALRSKLTEAYPDWLDQATHTQSHADVPIYNPIEFTPVPYYGIRSLNGKGVGISAEKYFGALIFRTDFLKSIGLNRRNVAAVQSTGDSNWPDIPPTDGVVLCQLITEEAITHGKYHAFRLGNDLLIKKLFQQSNGDLLAISANSAYEPQIINHANRHEFELIGRVKWFCSAID